MDLDGTLLDLASSPARVVAPKRLSATLKRVRDGLGGALAIVSGRTLEEIDRLLHPLELPIASEHGAVIRCPSGAIEEAPNLHRLPEEWLSHLRAQVRDWDGVLLEEKRHSVAVHFRLAPLRAQDVRDLVTSLVWREPKCFEVLTAKMAFEIRCRDVTKAHAVKLLMDVPPFRGRLPVFVGDDVTDKDGMEAARELGGFGLQVAPTFQGRPSAVRVWLRRAAASLLSKEP
jgi:trehalose 6-phosphate phosphatase